MGNPSAEAFVNEALKQKAALYCHDILALSGCQASGVNSQWKLKSNLNKARVRGLFPRTAVLLSEIRPLLEVRKRMNDRELFENTIPRHLKTWRNIYTTSGITKPELAEETVNSLYRRLKKKPPESIIWCDSPYQMATLPVLVASIVDSAEWKQLCQNSRTSSPGFESEWERGWTQIEDTFSTLITQVLQRPNDFAVDASVRETCRNKLVAILRKSLSEDRPIRREWLGCREVKDLPLHFRSVKADPDFARHILQASQGIDAIAGLKLFDQANARRLRDTQPIDRATDGLLENLTNVSAYVGTTVVGLSRGAWDSRLLTDLVPAVEKLNNNRHDADSLTKAARIKLMCSDVEQISRLMQPWLQGLPAMANRITTQTVEDLREHFSNLGDSKFEKAKNIVKGSVEGWKHWKGIFLEDFGYRNHATIWLPHSVPWLPFALAGSYIKPRFFRDFQDEVERLAFLSHAAAGYLFLPGVCFVCRKTDSLTTNQAGRPHNAEGPAATWVDGYCVYSWRGITVDQKIIENANSLNVYDIAREANAELRRIKIDLYGESRYLMDAGAEVLHADETGILYRVKLASDEDLVMVKVKNSTPEPDGSYKNYFLRVPPWVTRARQAVAWTFGMNEAEYYPNFHS